MDPVRGGGSDQRDEDPVSGELPFLMRRHCVILTLCDATATDVRVAPPRTACYVLDIQRTSRASACRLEAMQLQI